MAASRRDKVCTTRNRLPARYLGRSRILPSQRPLPTNFPGHIRRRRHCPQRRRIHTLFLSSRNPLPLLRPHSPPPLQRPNLPQSVLSHGQKGISDGLETDTNSFIYGGNIEDNSIVFFNPANGTVNLFTRDPRIGWADTLSVASDGYVYFMVNQLWRSPSFYPGTDRRVKPYVLFRAKLPGNGTKVVLT